MPAVPTVYFCLQQRQNESKGDLPMVSMVHSFAIKKEIVQGEERKGANSLFTTQNLSNGE